MKPGDVAFFLAVGFFFWLGVRAFSDGKKPPTPPRLRDPQVEINGKPSPNADTPTRSHADTPSSDPRAFELVPGVLIVRGLLYDPPSGETPAKFWRPLKPDQVEIELSTFDGQKWKARWEKTK